MADLSQDDRWLQIDKFGSQQFLLESFTGSERVSESFEYTLELVTDKTDVDAKTVVGKTVGFRLKLPDESLKEFHGYVRSFEYGTYRELEEGYRSYRITVVPWTWLLSLGRDSRVFQEKTAPQIVEQVFKDRGFTDYKLSLKGTYAKLDYCVQYRESDLDFVSRLMAEHGIFYYFTHETAKHQLILADAATAYVDAAGGEAEYRPDTEAEWGTLLDWQRRVELVTSKVELADYDFEAPAKVVEAKEKTKLKVGVAKDRVEYDFPGDFTKAADGKPLAVARMEGHEAGGLIVHGASLRPDFHPGAKFKLAAHPVEAEVNQKYALVDTRIKAYEPSPLLPTPDDTARDRERTLYHNAFEAVPADVPARPRYVAPRPVVHGLQSAKVVGPKNSEIHADKYGRIRVQFHWDREGKYDDKSSCWIRVAQTWAGKKYGSQFIPRVGHEVLVDFLEGDPDKPIVVGSVYNADNMPPYDPVNDATHSGIKTFSSDKAKTKNFNELRFEDKIGEELVYFHAEKNFERVVENDDKLKVGFDTKDKGDQTIDIFNDRTVTLDKGKDTLTIKTGDRTVTLDKGNDSLTVKQGNLKIAVKAGAIDIEAAKSITLKVGGSTLKMDPTSITLDSTKIVAKAKLKAEVSGTLVDVKASGVLTLKGGLVKIN